jgi:hypothetical protein
MRKFFRALKALGRILNQPSLLNLVLDEDGSWNKKLRDMKGNAYRFPSIDIRLLLKTEGLSVAPFAFLDGGSLPTDIALLKSLAVNIPNIRYFEIARKFF